MMRFRTIPRVALALALVMSLAAGCFNPSNEDASATAPDMTTLAPVSTSSSSPNDTPGPDEIDMRFELPPAARVSSGAGDPRPPSYWVVWNSCAPENRAEEAAANGGREAGWVLVDDILADPGIGLGDHLLTSCEESVALLNGQTGIGEATTDPVYDLATGLLAAELNLNVGAETCQAAEETVIGAHIVLASAGFDGVSSSPIDAEAGGALPDLIDLLAAYNSGELCR